jgi:hypothetical protein
MKIMIIILLGVLISCGKLEITEEKNKNQIVN